MPIFSYVARDGQGHLVNETITFRDEIALRLHLRKNELYLVSIEQRRQKRPLAEFGRSVGLRDIILMSRQLRTIVKAGIPLVVGLDAVTAQTINKKLSKVLGEVTTAVGNGARFADTLELYPHIFSKLLIALIRSGEESGRLPEALDEASRQMEQQLSMRQKITSAMIYPCFTLLVTIGMLTVMMIWIVPTFAKMYTDLHAVLPSITLSLVWISDRIIHQGWIVIVLAATAIYALIRYQQTPKGRYHIDDLRLKIPFLGTLFLKSASANLTGSLSGLLSSGVPLLLALNTASDVSGNEVIGAAAREAALKVTDGRKLSDELERSGKFPIMVIRMTAIAEDVGTLPEVLREISLSYIEDVDYAAKSIISLIEPVMILTVGFVVGFILLALYYPIFNLGNVFVDGS